MPEKRKYPIYFYLIALLIPVVFFILLEIFLRVISYGDIIPQWVEPSKQFPDYEMLNPEISKRYFKNIERYPTPHYDGFRKEKLPGTFRVFIMGGSSAAGFPYPENGAFSRYICRYLKNQYPGHYIEVINVALSAVNSYTIRDLFPGVIEKTPDLIIIYAGHNEYYGALGVGSSEFLGNTTLLVNFILATRDIRTIQLLRNIINGLRNIVSGDKKPGTDATLMARMVGKHLIPLYSSTYQHGIDQFRINMTAVLEMAREKSIPLILGQVSSNLKDQPPFASIATDSLSRADQIFKKAEQEYSAGNMKLAALQYEKAKELDALRFRAPRAINAVIVDLGKQFNIPVVDIDSVFRSASGNNITGYSLMTDHVHPNLKGIDLMGAAFVDGMERSGFVPHRENKRYSISEANQIASEWHLTEIDSLYTEIRLAYLKSGWPFVPMGKPNTALHNFKPENLIEDLALKMFTQDVNWENAHVQAAFWYKKNKDTRAFVNEMEALIEVMPFHEKTYKILIDGLIELQEFTLAFNYLNILDEIKPSAYSNKWLGILHLYNARYEKAQNYLEAGLAINATDAQALYNLTGVYIKLRKYRRALETIEQCLSVDPDFPAAKTTYMDLKKVLENIK